MIFKPPTISQFLEKTTVNKEISLEPTWQPNPNNFPPDRRCIAHRAACILHHFFFALLTGNFFSFLHRSLPFVLYPMVAGSSVSNLAVNVSSSLLNFRYVQLLTCLKTCAVRSWDFLQLSAILYWPRREERSDSPLPSTGFHSLHSW